MFAAVGPITPPEVDWLAIAPVIALAGAGVLVVLAGDPAPPTRRRRRCRC